MAPEWHNRYDMDHAYGNPDVGIHIGCRHPHPKISRALTLLSDALILGVCELTYVEKGR